jgi:hypothetical protein
VSYAIISDKQERAYALYFVHGDPADEEAPHGLMGLFTNLADAEKARDIYEAEDELAGKEMDEQEQQPW